MTFEVSTSAKLKVADWSDPLLVPRGKYDPDIERDRQFDGHLISTSRDLYPPETPLRHLFGDGKRSESTEQIIYVNGIHTCVERQLLDMLSIEKSGAQVAGVHNSTSGTAKDIVNFLKQLYGATTLAAEETVQRAMVDAILNGDSAHFLGHSQGALIISRALNLSARVLEQLHGLTPEAIREGLGRIKIETHAGATFNWSPGPQYLHYVNQLDPVCRRAGMLNKRAGNSDGALLVFEEKFAPDALPPLTSDRLSQVHDARLYFERMRVPFAEGLERARAGAGLR